MTDKLIFEPEVLTHLLPTESVTTASDVAEIINTWVLDPPDPQYEQILNATPVND